MGLKDIDAFLSAPEGEQTIRNPTAWERGRMTASGALEKAGVPAGGAKNLAEFAIPGSNTEAGIQAALSLVPIVGPAAGKMLPALAKEAPMLYSLLTRGGRVALPAVGGAVGSATEGKSPLWGATKGAAIGGVGEAVPMAAEWAGRSFGKGAMERRMATSLGKTMTDAVPALGPMKNADDIMQTVLREKGMEAIGTAHKAAMDDISAQLMARRVSGGHPILGPGPFRTAGHDAIEVPALREVAGKSLFTFNEATTWLRTLADEGWLESQRVKSGVDAVQARALRTKAREQIVDVLNQDVPGLGKKYDQAQADYDKGRNFIDLFRQPGVFKEGKLDPNALRDTIGKTDKSGTHTWGQAIDRASRATPQEAENFFRALFRGGPMSGRDTPGEGGLHIGFSRGPHVGLRMPHPPSYAGTDLPAWARPGGLSQASMPISFGALGLTREPEGR